jgi:hypothetical protein
MRKAARIGRLRGFSQRLRPRAPRAPRRPEGAGVSAAEGTAAADRAMALLRNAVDEGRRDLTEFRAADALDALHEREDFKKLLAELEKPSPDNCQGTRILTKLLNPNCYEV